MRDIKDIEKKNVSTKEELDALYNQSALTWEGLLSTDESLRQVQEWLEEHKVDTSSLVFHIISGEYMNEAYGLRGDNAYPKDLTIVSVTGIDVTPVIIPRFEVGGRWFDDIVDNNRRRN